MPSRWTRRIRRCGFINAWSTVSFEPMRSRARCVPPAACGCDWRWRNRHRARSRIAPGDPARCRPWSSTGLTRRRTSRSLSLKRQVTFSLAVPERVSESVMRLLGKIGVEVRTSACDGGDPIGGVHLADGSFVPSELVVWATGVKAPDFLKDLAGLETGRNNQLVVTPTLQATRDPNIFAALVIALYLVTLAAYAQSHHGAQAAHLLASHLVKRIQPAP